MKHQLVASKAINNGKICYKNVSKT